MLDSSSVNRSLWNHLFTSSKCSQFRGSQTPMKMVSRKYLSYCVSLFLRLYSIINEISYYVYKLHTTLKWRYNGRDNGPNHRRFYCLLNRLFRRRSKKNQRSASAAFVRGIHRWPVNSPHKGQVTWKTIPFEDVIINRWDMTKLFDLMK